MYLATLHNRLIEVVRKQVQNGQLTERRLARLAGISQPHLNNLLKGKRSLYPEIGDRLLAALQMSVLDLLEAEEGPKVLPGQAERDRYTEVPVLEGRIGAGLPLPPLGGWTERRLWPSDLLAQVVEPRFAWLAADERMRPLVETNDLVLLDQSQDKRTRLEPDGLYLVNRWGQGVIRKLRSGARCLCLLTAQDSQFPDAWDKIFLQGSSLLDIVLAKVVWVMRPLDSGAPLPPSPPTPPPEAERPLLLD
jgi:transcriptional regulator with XRE-family HTH domain